MQTVAHLVREATSDRPAQPVLVLGPTDASTAVLILGVMAAGSVVGVLDVRSSDTRLRDQIEAVGARVLCATPEQFARACALGVDGVRVITRVGVPSRDDALPEEPDADVILFTFGSTGNARAVLLPQRRFTQIAAWSDREADPTIRRVGILLPISFDHGLNRTLYALLTGRTGVYYDLASRGIVDLSAWVRAEQIDELSMPIDVLRPWLNEMRAAGDASPLPF